MNESFADFEHIAQFKTNKDYLPNYHKLQEESISGYVSVSAYGGYSCNSEYEFLTGNTLGFLPSGSAVFTQYLNDKQNGLVSWLNELGYTTQAISPCSEGLWDIGNAYEQLQFKSKLFNCGDYISNCQYINNNMSDSSFSTTLRHNTRATRVRRILYGLPRCRTMVHMMTSALFRLR